jgi:hypothetical protein
MWACGPAPRSSPSFFARFARATRCAQPLEASAQANAFATQRDDPFTQIFRTRALLFRPEQRPRMAPGMVQRRTEIIQPRFRREPCTEKSKSSAAISESA